MRKILYLIIMSLMIVSCRKTTLPNPIRKSSIEDFTKDLNLVITEDKDTEEYEYTTINKLHQVTYLYRGIECTLRVSPRIGEDISGLYYSWEEEEPFSINGHEGILRLVTRNDGYILCNLRWEDKYNFSYTIMVKGIGPGNIDDVKSLTLSLLEKLQIKDN